MKIYTQLFISENDNEKIINKKFNNFVDYANYFSSNISKKLLNIPKYYDMNKYELSHTHYNDKTNNTINDLIVLSSKTDYDDLLIVINLLTEIR